MNRDDLISQLKNYNSNYHEELAFVKPFTGLLAHPRCFHRDHFPGHITGSAWIVDRSREFVLLTLHAKLNKWLQPGGHADGDEDVARVALREATEETGLINFQLLSDSFFDIDIHTIPARKNEPEHLHYDVRYIFEASLTDSLIVTSESHDLQWKKMTDLHSLDNKSIYRMIEKTIAMR